MNERVGTVEPINHIVDKIPKPNDKIKVRCRNCDEEFEREYKRIGQLHRCPTHKTDGISRVKWCNMCKIYRTTDQFIIMPERYDGLGACCKKCSEDLLQRFENYLLIHNLPTITSEDMLYQWHLQGGRSYNTRKYLDPNNITINRIKPELEVNPRNIYLTTPSSTEYLKDNLTPVRLECKPISDEAKVPTRKRTTDAGYDVYSIEEVVIEPHGTKNIHTGVILSCPEGYYITVEGRSSMWVQGVTPFHGIIDSTYCGELMIALMNISDKPYKVNFHDRIAQVIIQRYCNVDIVEVCEFGPDYNQRGVAGFGSSGK